jgi:hypothetical protein
MFPPSGEEGLEEIPNLLGPIGGANLNHWRMRLALSKGPRRVGVFSPHPKKEADTVSETLCSVVF